MPMPKPGERRRTVALASLFSLVIYLAIYAVAKELPGVSFGQDAAHFLSLSATVQLLAIVPIWAGSALIVHGQRQLISHSEGAWGALMAISHVRGMRTIGLTLAAVIAALVGGLILTGSSTPMVVISGALATLYLLALGLPNAPNQRYQNDLPQPAQLTPYTPLLPSTPPPPRMIDAGPQR